LLAVQRGNLFSINGDLINRFGPRLVEAATLLCEDLEQARARRLGSQATNGQGR
jgi:iron complex transport system substrate-binding protein